MRPGFVFRFASHIIFRSSWPRSTFSSFFSLRFKHSAGVPAHGTPVSPLLFCFRLDWNPMRGHFFHGFTCLPIKQVPRDVMPYISRDHERSPPNRPTWTSPPSSLRARYSL